LDYGGEAAIELLESATLSLADGHLEAQNLSWASKASSRWKVSWSVQSIPWHFDLSFRAHAAWSFDQTE